MPTDHETLQTKLSGCDLSSFYDRVLVKPDPQPEKTTGGLFFADEAKDGITTLRGTVLKYGPKCLYVAVGMRVVWNKYFGTELEYNGEKLLSIREEELLGAEPEPKRPQPQLASESKPC